MNKKYCLYASSNDTYIMKDKKYKILYRQSFPSKYTYLWTCKTYKYAQKMLENVNKVWNGAFEIKEIEENE